MTKKPAAQPGALCQCGRLLGHTGRHIGSGGKPATPASAKRPKIAVAVEEQLRHCHARIARLITEIREREADLERARAELAPLARLHDHYKDLALPAPAQPMAEPPAPPPAAPTSPGEPAAAPMSPVLSAPVARPDRVDGRTGRPLDPPTRRLAAPPPDPYAPVEADHGNVAIWAVQRGVTFRTWDDLPAVNRKRESLGLPVFKRPLGRVRA